MGGSVLVSEPEGLQESSPTGIWRSRFSVGNLDPKTTPLSEVMP